MNVLQIITSFVNISLHTHTHVQQIPPSVTHMHMKGRNVWQSDIPPQTLMVNLTFLFPEWIYNN